MTLAGIGGKNESQCYTHTTFGATGNGRSGKNGIYCWMKGKKKFSV